MSTIAASPSRARSRPSSPGPSRSRRMPSVEAGGRAAVGGGRRRRGATPPGRPASTSRCLGEARRRPEPALLDQRPDPACRATLERRERAGGHPPGDGKLCATVGEHGPNGGQPRGERRCRRGGGQRPSREDDVGGRVQVEAETGPPAEVVHAVAGDLLEPARQGVVGGEVREVAEHAGPGHRDRVGRVAVVGQRARQVGGGRGHEGAVVGRARQRHRPGTQDDEPRRVRRRGQAPQTRPERLGELLLDEGDRRCAGRPEPGEVARRQLPSRGVERGGQRTRARRGAADGGPGP